MTRGTMTGRVVRVVTEKGFGFLRGDDSTERFFHYTSITDGSKLVELVPGTLVTFDPVKGDKGPRAENVAVAS